MPGWRGIFRGDESEEDIKRRKTAGLNPYPIHLIPPPGMTGIIVNVRKNDKGNIYDVKWQKGGVRYNYTENELKPKN